MLSVLSNARPSAAADPDQEHTTLTLTKKLKVVVLLLSLFSVIAVHISSWPVGLQAFGHGFANLVGQEHPWTMFSADPRGTSLDLWAEIVLEDGRSSQWRIQRARIGGDFGFYHWVQWMETAVLDAESAQLHGLADWLIASSSSPVDEVVIYGEQRLGRPPGMQPAVAEVEVLGRYSNGAPG